jgi:hypothetical protein
MKNIGNLDLRGRKFTKPSEEEKRLKKKSASRKNQRVEVKKELEEDLLTQELIDLEEWEKYEIYEFPNWLNEI